MNESHQTLQAMRKSLTREEFGEDTSEHATLSGSGCVKACKYTNECGGLIATERLKHCLQNEEKYGFLGHLFGSGDLCGANLQTKRCQCNLAEQKHITTGPCFLSVGTYEQLHNVVVPLAHVDTNHG